MPDIDGLLTDALGLLEPDQLAFVASSAERARREFRSAGDNHSWAMSVVYGVLGLSAQKALLVKSEPARSAV